MRTINKVAINDHMLDRVEELRPVPVIATAHVGEHKPLYFRQHIGEGTVLIDGELHEFHVASDMGAGTMIVQFSKPYPRGVNTIVAGGAKAMLAATFGLDLDDEPIPIGQPEPAVYDRLWDFFAAEGDEGWEQRADDDGGPA